MECLSRFYKQIELNLAKKVDEIVLHWWFRCQAQEFLCEEAALPGIAGQEAADTKLVEVRDDRVGSDVVVELLEPLGRLPRLRFGQEQEVS
jgi:hypothetical protein